MAFTQFAANQICLTFGSDKKIKMAQFSVEESIELSYIRPLLHIRAVASLGGTEKIRINIYSDSGYTNVLYQSAWSDINTTNISNLADGNSWIGRVRTDFDRENLNANLTYYMEAEIDNYTENGSTFYAGLMYDFPARVYANDLDGNAISNFWFKGPISFQLFGYK